MRRDCTKLRWAALTSDSENNSVTGSCQRRELVTRKDGLSSGGVSTRIGKNFFAVVYSAIVVTLFSYQSEFTRIEDRLERKPQSAFE